MRNYQKLQSLQTVSFSQNSSSAIQCQVHYTAVNYYIYRMELLFHQISPEKSSAFPNPEDQACGLTMPKSQLPMYVWGLQSGVMVLAPLWHLKMPWFPQRNVTSLIHLNDLKMTPTQHWAWCDLSYCPDKCFKKLNLCPSHEVTTHSNEENTNKSASFCPLPNFLSTIERCVRHTPPNMYLWYATKEKQSG